MTRCEHTHCHAMTEATGYAGCRLSWDDYTNRTRAGGQPSLPSSNTFRAPRPGLSRASSAGLEGASSSQACHHHTDDEAPSSPGQGKTWAQHDFSSVAAAVCLLGFPVLIAFAYAWALIAGGSQ